MTYKKRLKKLYDKLHAILDEFVDLTNEEGEAKREVLDELRDMPLDKNVTRKQNAEERKKLVIAIAKRVVEFHLAQNIFLVSLKRFVERNEEFLDHNTQVIIDYVHEGVFTAEYMKNLGNEIDPDLDLIIEKIDDKEEIQA